MNKLFIVLLTVISFMLCACHKKASPETEGPEELEGLVDGDLFNVFSIEKAMVGPEGETLTLKAMMPIGRFGLYIDGCILSEERDEYGNFKRVSLETQVIKPMRTSGTGETDNFIAKLIDNYTIEIIVKPDNRPIEWKITIDNCPPDTFSSYAPSIIFIDQNLNPDSWTW